MTKLVRFILSRRSVGITVSKLLKWMNELVEFVIEKLCLSMNELGLAESTRVTELKTTENLKLIIATIWLNLMIDDHFCTMEFVFVKIRQRVCLLHHRTVFVTVLIAASNSTPVSLVSIPNVTNCCSYQSSYDCFSYSRWLCSTLPFASIRTFYIRLDTCETVSSMNNQVPLGRQIDLIFAWSWQGTVLTLLPGTDK